MKKLILLVVLAVATQFLMAQTQFFSPLGAVPVGPNGPASNKVKVSAYCCPSTALEITTNVPVGENDFQWINIPLDGLNAGLIGKLVVCYQIQGGGGSYISQLRLTEMMAPNAAAVKVDDPTDLNSAAPTCFSTKAAYVVNGTTTLAIKVVMRPGDKIIIGGITVAR
ncbi:MAG TPA: hypothetical protein PLC89_02365 [Haliscomenobacter sp.]|uniref:hypothetical protein n=1 Tax=Haliscomenobacter sp. TaxID=2717303 RepID=UPI002CA6D136|nr:hypothetical protein [Haliscomenobacter sp.]HOY16101.1 hypothetical protein [Haliscomenobacter sp.]HPH21395.1 hypothetical protein [Haliscomenobacter sp.]